jgi:hypothetical protein
VPQAKGRRNRRRAGKWAGGHGPPCRSSWSASRWVTQHPDIAYMMGCCRIHPEQFGKGGGSESELERLGAARGGRHGGGRAGTAWKCRAELKSHITLHHITSHHITSYWVSSGRARKGENAEKTEKGVHGVDTDTGEGPWGGARRKGGRPMGVLSGLTRNAFFVTRSSLEMLF